MPVALSEALLWSWASAHLCNTALFSYDTVTMALRMNEAAEIEIRRSLGLLGDGVSDGGI